MNKFYLKYKIRKESSSGQAPLRPFFAKATKGKQGSAGQASYKHSSSGQAMLTATMFFLAISLTIVLGIAAPILKQVKIGTNLIQSKQSYFLSEGALEDAVYRAQNGKTVSSGDTVIVAGYTTTINVTSGSNGDVIDATASYGNVVRKMEAQISTGVGSSFNYGVQAGTGGFNLTGGSSVTGSVYANGPVYGSGGASISGSATSADGAAATSDQANTTPTPISSCTSSTCVSFGTVSTSAQDIGQSFIVSTTSPIHDIQFYLKKTGTPGNITLHLVSDTSGSPGSSDLSSVSIPASQVSTTFGWVDAVFSSNPTLTAGTTYWFVLDTSCSSNCSANNYTIGANSSYSSGTAKVGAYGGSWSNTTPSGLDLYFNVYLGGVVGYIGGGSYVGALTVGGDVWGNTVVGVSTPGTIYCQTGSTNNKSCNTSRSDPSAVGFPISDSNIQGWKAEAAGGTGTTYSGNLSIGYQGTTSPLTRINGNLSVSSCSAATFSNPLEVTGNVTTGGGCTLVAGPLTVDGNLDVESSMTITGTVYVKGTITVGSGSTVQLGSIYGANSGVLVSDGTISLSGGSHEIGSGQTGSSLMIITTSNCPSTPSCPSTNAISVSGGSGAVVLYAQNGTISTSGGTGVESMTANMITASNGATINYNSGLINVNFSSGPSGGYDISNWKEVQ